MDIGEILLLQNVISREQMLLARQNANGKRLDHQVVEMGLASEEQVLQALAAELGMRYVELAEVVVDKELLDRFPAREIFRHTLFPLSRRNGSVVVATSDPFDLEALDEVSSLSGFRLEPVLAASAATRSVNWSPSGPKKTSSCSKDLAKPTANWQKWRRPPRSSNWSTSS
jgi:general secretion pathway protein E/type IV pilus assembly protein PilB